MQEADAPGAASRNVREHVVRAPSQLPQIEVRPDTEDTRAKEALTISLCVTAIFRHGELYVWNEDLESGKCGRMRTRWLSCAGLSGPKPPQARLRSRRKAPKPEAKQHQEKPRMLHGVNRVLVRGGFTHDAGVQIVRQS